jgi:tRNA modification GTPase
VIDTAGIRETEDPVEQEGVRRARKRAGDADLVLWMTDARHEKSFHEGSAPVWLIRNKIDLDATGPEADLGKPVLGQGQAGASLRISAGRGDGVQELIGALVGFARDYFGSDEGGLIGRERQRKLLQQTAASLARSIGVISQGEELAAEELRTAAYSLGRLLGRVDVEDILDLIFKEFCIGK